MNPFLTILIFFSLNFGAPVQNRTAWVGTVSNGYKGDSIRFDISADGKRLEKLTFTGYWRCSGGIEQMTMGPEKSFSIKDGKVLGVITEPENGGASAFRFDLNAVISGKSASGTLRVNLNALGCDTYQLKWTAIRK